MKLSTKIIWGLSLIISFGVGFYLTYSHEETKRTYTAEPKMVFREGTPLELSMAGPLTYKDRSDKITVNTTVDIQDGTITFWKNGLNEDWRGQGHNYIKFIPTHWDYLEDTILIILNHKDIGEYGIIFEGSWEELVERLRGEITLNDENLECVVGSASGSDSIFRLPEECTSITGIPNSPDTLVCLPQE